MSKKKRKKPNNTPVSKRTRKGGALKSPFAALGDSVSWSSWKDDHMPNILWACVLTGSLDRDHYLQLFRDVAITAKSHLNENKDASLCHNFLSTLEPEIFRDLFTPLLEDSRALIAISSLRLVEGLPDAHLWQSILPEEESLDRDWKVLSMGVLATMDHQSQEATDVRWLKVAFLDIIGRMHMKEEMTKNVRLYPDHGDMRSVRPSIRAMEMIVRQMETGPEKPDHIPNMDSEIIWKELLEKTPCIASQEDEYPTQNHDELQKEFAETIDEVSLHFMAQIENTHVDAKCDASFGLVLSCLSLSFELAHIPSHQFASGRIILRTIVENFITLSYLRSKDDPTIWAQYRNYGSGQTALAFLKNSDIEDAPDFIDMDRLEILANEDVWLETIDIDLGSWAKSNLRLMSEQAGVKDVYDRYYDWTSGFVHSHWGAVRDSVFTTCLNPLHRLHRVPKPINSMPSVLPDCGKICNRALDELNALYPNIKTRIHWRK